jgi:hypothetical protein
MSFTCEAVLLPRDHASPGAHAAGFAEPGGKARRVIGRRGDDARHLNDRYPNMLSISL